MSRVENFKMKKGKLQVSGADAVLRMFKSERCVFPSESRYVCGQNTFWICTERMLLMFVACELWRPQNNTPLQFKLHTYLWSCTICCWMEMCDWTVQTEILHSIIHRNEHSLSFAVPIIVLDLQTNWVLTKFCQWLFFNIPFHSFRNKSTISGALCSGKKKKSMCWWFGVHCLHHQVRLS